jgi:branched-chain amino acid transport system ATP-binding protein
VPVADALVVQNLSMDFGGIRALHEVSFRVSPGQICGLIGPNGAGKTTLFNCISRVYQPTAGSVRLGDVDLLRLPAHEIAGKGIARTFQNLGLFPHLSLLENTMTGAHPHLKTGFVRAVTRWGVRREERELRADAYRILCDLDLHELAFHPADGLPFGTLKRLELARALAARPKVLLLDEPAGGLTHEEVESLAQTIRQIRAQYDLTILLVEHHMGLVMSLSDALVAMDNGELIASGAPDEVRNDPNVIRAYLGAGA